MNVRNKRADVHQVELLPALTSSGLHVRDVPLQAVRPIGFSGLVQRVASAFRTDTGGWATREGSKKVLQTHNRIRGLAILYDVNDPSVRTK